MTIRSLIMSPWFQSKKRIILLLGATQRLRPRTPSLVFLKTKTRRSTLPPSNRGPVPLKPASHSNRNSQAASLSSVHNNSRRMSPVHLPKKVAPLKMKLLLLRRNSMNLSHVMRLNSRLSLKSTRKSRVSGVSRMSRSSLKRFLATITLEMT